MLITEIRLLNLDYGQVMKFIGILLTILLSERNIKMHVKILKVALCLLCNSVFSYETSSYNQGIISVPSVVAGNKAYKVSLVISSCPQTCVKIDDFFILVCDAQHTPLKHTCFSWHLEHFKTCKSSYNPNFTNMKDF